MKSFCYSKNVISILGTFQPNKNLYTGLHKFDRLFPGFPKITPQKMGGFFRKPWKQIREVLGFILGNTLYIGRGAHNNILWW